MGVLLCPAGFENATNLTEDVSGPPPVNGNQLAAVSRLGIQEQRREL